MEDSQYLKIHSSDTYKLQVDKDEVILRRSIGLKKDEYFLDKKHVT
jgi:hypothetical protein